MKLSPHPSSEAATNYPKTKLLQKVDAPSVAESASEEVAELEEVVEKQRLWANMRGEVGAVREGAEVG